VSGGMTKECDGGSVREGRARRSGGVSASSIYEEKELSYPNYKKT
jgi:hypothetical protein